MKSLAQMKKQGGFTLIELMIVVAIVGILAAVGLPAYSDYMAKAKISEAFVMLDGEKTKVAESATTNNAWPAAADAGVSLPSNAKYASALVYDGAGEIQLTLANINGDVDGTTVTFTGTLNGDATVSWACSMSADAKYRPASCK